MTWPSACARMCRAYIRQLAHIVIVSELCGLWNKCSLLSIMLCNSSVGLCKQNYKSPKCRGYDL